MQNREGEKVPQVNFKVYQDGDWEEISSDQVFANKTVVLFALPGAYTPTCSSLQTPSFIRYADKFKEYGVDDIVCLSVNDPFVMNAWQMDQEAQVIRFLPDGNGEFTEGMGMLVDKSELGFGKRSWRYSMLVEDGVIEKMFIEPEEPGDPYKVSGAETMLGYIDPDFRPPEQIAVFSKRGCPHCHRAFKLLEEKGKRYENIELGSNGVDHSSLRAVSGNNTTPQIFIEGKLIGGADQLEEYFQQGKA